MKEFTVSQLIVALQEIYKDYGDIPVVIAGSYYSWEAEMEIGLLPDSRRTSSQSDGPICEIKTDLYTG